MLTTEDVPYKIYNIDNNRPEKLMDFIGANENTMGKKAVKEFYSIQPGDVYQSYADVTDLMRDVGFKLDITIHEGIKWFAAWYKEFCL